VADVADVSDRTDIPDTGLRLGLALASLGTLLDSEKRAHFIYVMNLDFNITQF
jgi:hypothetical protein